MQAVPLNLVEKALYKYIIIIIIICIKSDFLKHKMVKTNDKIRHIEVLVVISPLSRKTIHQILLQITAFKVIWCKELTYKGAMMLF